MELQLQNPEQNNKLQTLIAEANEATEAFRQTQIKATEIKTNIDRNKKMLEALQNENAELQAKSDKVTVSETGEVNFSEFDDYSDQIFANVRKIKALERIVKKLDLKFELFLLNEYTSASQTSESKIKSALRFYVDCLFSSGVLDDQTIHKLNSVYYILQIIWGYGEIDPVIRITNHVKNNLNGNFSIPFDNIELKPKSLYSHQYSGDVIFGPRRKAEIVRKLEELEKSEIN